MTITPSSPMSDAAQIEQLQSELAIARNFPSNTTPASRHLELIADSLAAGERYMMLEEEPKHCAITIYSVLLGFYRSSAETAEAIEARDRYKKMYNAEVKAAAESKARCNEALGWSEQQLQAAKSSHEGQLRNTLAFKAEKEAAELRLAEAVNIIWRGTFNNKADEDRAQKFVNGPVGQQQDSGADQ